LVLGGNDDDLPLKGIQSPDQIVFLFRGAHEDRLWDGPETSCAFRSGRCGWGDGAFPALFGNPVRRIFPISQMKHIEKQWRHQQKSEAG
jgi:hypothetical protein